MLSRCAMTLTLAAALSLFSQFLIGPPLPPLPPEVARAQEEALRYRIQKLPDGAPNGWEVIVSGAEHLPKFEKPVLDAYSAAVKGKTFERESLEKIAAHADFCRQTIRTALSKSGWQARPWEPDISPPENKGGRAMARICPPIIARMLISSEDRQNPELLMEDLCLLLELASMSQLKATGLTEGLVSSSLGAQLDRVIVKFLFNDQLDSEQLGLLAAELKKRPRSPMDLRESFRHEFGAQCRLFSYTLGNLENWSRSEPQIAKVNPFLRLVMPVFVDPARSRQLINGLGTEIVSKIGTPFSTDGPPGFAQVRDWKPNVTNSDWLRRNSLGESMVMGAMKTYAHIMPGIAMNQSARGMISVAVALKRWQLERGPKLPERLQQLVPHYLPSVPVDYMDGKPLRYDRQQRIIYSVGSDLIDDIPPIPETPSLVIGDGNAVLFLP